MSGCHRFWQVLRDVEGVVEEYKAKSRYRKCLFFFRGEYHRYPHGGDVPLPASQCFPSLFRQPCHYKNERKIFYEALRRYPDDFTAGMTTFDMLAKMQHYQFPTRLLDITSDVRLATAMATMPFNDVESAYNAYTSFVYVYAVREDCIKYTDSDTVSMIANLARVDDEKVKFEDLGFLGYEVARERPGFDWRECANQFREDLQKVWCVLPVLRNDRIRLQSGAFFLFGCGNRKEILRPIFRKVILKTKQHLRMVSRGSAMSRLMENIKGILRRKLGNLSRWRDTISILKCQFTRVSFRMNWRNGNRRKGKMTYTIQCYVKKVKLGDSGITSLVIRPTGKSRIEDEENHCLGLDLEKGALNSVKLLQNEIEIKNGSLNGGVMAEALMGAKFHGCEIEIDVETDGSSDKIVKICGVTIL